MIFEITLEEIKILSALIDNGKYYHKEDKSIIVFAEGSITIEEEAHTKLLQKEAIVFLEEVLYENEVYEQFGITEEARIFIQNFEEGLMF